MSRCMKRLIMTTHRAVVQCSEIRHINTARLHLSNIRAHCAEPASKFAKIHALIDNGNGIIVTSTCQ